MQNDANQVVGYRIQRLFRGTWVNSSQRVSRPERAEELFLACRAMLPGREFRIVKEVETTTYVPILTTDNVAERNSTMATRNDIDGVGLYQQANGVWCARVGWYRRAGYGATPADATASLRRKLRRTRGRCNYCGQCTARDSMLDGACVDCAAQLAEWRWLAESTPLPRVVGR